MVKIIRYVIIFIALVLCNCKTSDFTYRSQSMGFLDVQGKALSKFDYDSIDLFNEGLAPVRKKGKWGYIDKTGEVVIDCKYDTASHFLEDYAVVAINKKFGYINKKGDVVIPLEFEGCSVFYNGYATVKKNGKIGVIDTNGKVILPYEYDNYTLYSYGFFCLSKDSKYRFITIKGEVKGGEYESALPFYDGIAKIRKDGNYYAINDKFKIVAEQAVHLSNEKNLSHYFYIMYSSFGYDDGLDSYMRKNIPLFSCYYESGLILSIKESKYGFVDKEGNIVIPHEYDYASNFNEGFALVRRSEKTYIINKQNRIIKEFKHNVVSKVYPSSGLFLYQNDIDGILGYLNIDERVIYRNKLKRAFMFQNGYALISDGKYWGAIDETGKVIIPIEYDTLGPFSEGFFYAGKYVDE